MNESSFAVDAEVLAMQRVAEALNPLEKPERNRVLRWAQDKFGEVNIERSVESFVHSNGPPVRETASAPVSTDDFDDFASLYDASKPQTDVERALVGAVWATREGAGNSFRAHDVNTLLKDLGFGILNITDALNALQARRPNEVMQVSKSGTSRQARKTYRVTRAGLERVNRMIRGGGGSDQE